ncbi:hypothetical protein BCR35DRAFT_303357 [Leucosporidium creatinivorum]|uniref:Uncharacterized protein n=1 Tax=Leucosporidium creatinivorum TaxID=106004 RepID=A0A1Y2FIS7_9BASI|nr:hypothetical protein BCR35DRAFT_303357 [Leucosporidium creatinivorum]
MDSNNPLEQVYQLLLPYLPHSIASPLHQLLAVPSNILENPSQLVPLAISFLALYAAVISFYNTARSALRFGWFLTKWGAILSALAVAWSGWNNAGTEEGATKGLRTAGNIGKQAFGLGAQGINWWMGGDNKRTAGRASRSRSASGRKRTWAKATDDGGWDDPDEVDLGAGANDVMKSVQDAVLTFLSSPGEAAKDSGKKDKSKAKKSTKKAQQEGVDLGSMATDYAMGRAKKVWQDWTGL